MPRGLQQGLERRQRHQRDPPRPLSHEAALNVVRGEDGVLRCAWGASTDDYRAYHDREWGFPVDADRRLFEKLCLEGFQSGLSWLTILRKRDAFRRAFASFDFREIAGWGDAQIERLLGDASIVRHRGKIASTINNAARAVELVEAEGSLAAYVWRSEPPRAVPTELPAQTLESAALAKDLKRRGWTFVGPTTVYAFMQATGLVNDHAAGCDVRERAERARAGFEPPAGATGRARVHS